MPLLGEGKRRRSGLPQDSSLHTCKLLEGWPPLAQAPPAAPVHLLTALCSSRILKNRKKTNVTSHSIRLASRKTRDEVGERTNHSHLYSKYGSLSGSKMFRRYVSKVMTYNIIIGMKLPVFWDKHCWNSWLGIRRKGKENIKKKQSFRPNTWHHYTTVHNTGSLTH